MYYALRQSKLQGEEGSNHYRHRPYFKDKTPKTWYSDLDYKCYIQDVAKLSNLSRDCQKKNENPNLNLSFHSLHSVSK